MDRVTPERAEELLEGARDARVLVIGDVMLDRYVSGTVGRVSPEAPVPVVRVESERSAVGGAGNVAANAAALGAHCDLVGCTGRDPAGEELRRALDALGVSMEGVVATDERPTTVKTRVLARRQQVVRVDRESDQDVSDELAEAMARAVVSLGADAHVVVVEDYDKGVLAPPVIDAARDSARTTGVPLVVDPKRRHFFSFEGATLFKPNAKEIDDALGPFSRPEDSVWMEDARLRLGCEHLLVTLGERGMTLQTGTGSFVEVPTVARGVYDVSGAGDTVTAVTAVVLAAGGRVEEAAVLANHAAAVEVGKPGVATVTVDEILDHVRSYHV